MENLGAELNKLTPEQRQAIMMQAQQEANQSVMQEMMKQMTLTCFQRCAGTSVSPFSRPGNYFIVPSLIDCSVDFGWNG